MTSQVDPELLGLLQSFPKFDLNDEVLPAIRVMAAEATEISDPPEGIVREEVQIGGERSVRALIYRNTDAESPSPAVLFFHGGGLVLNSPESSDARCMFWARHLRATIVSIAYRLAPENPFPAALEDGQSALEWMCDPSTQLNIDPERIAIAGDSAGGCVAVSVALAEKRAGRDSLCFMALLYPMLDDRTVLADHVVQGIWSARSNRYGWNSYLAGCTDLERAVPARANDLSGLPPTWIGVGELDLFFEENLTFGARLRDAGVACQIDTYPGAFHGFPAASEADVSKQLEHDYVTGLKTGLAI